jgi:hypothetical protein
MKIISGDKKRTVDVGGADIWKAVYSTIFSCVGKKRKKYPQVFSFFETGKCEGKDGYETARQFNLIRDELSQFSPEKAIYDIDNPKLAAPWKGRISPVITSCANFFTTADGRDLLYEVVSILTYAQVADTIVEIK